jgi:hypothetical protein
MPSLSETIAQLQNEYAALEAHGREQFSPKAMAALQQRLLAELKEKLGNTDLDIEAFKKKKGAVAAQLRELKEQRRAQIIAAIAAGELAIEEATDEFKALGWSDQEVARDIGKATRLAPPSTAGPNAASAGPNNEPTPAPQPEPAQPQKIVDPITDGRSDAQSVVYGDGAKPAGEPPLPPIEDPLSAERRKKNQPLRKPR